MLASSLGCRNGMSLDIEKSDLIALDIDHFRLSPETTVLVSACRLAQELVKTLAVKHHDHAVPSANGAGDDAGPRPAHFFGILDALGTPVGSC